MSQIQIVIGFHSRKPNDKIQSLLTFSRVILKDNVFFAIVSDSQENLHAYSNEKLSVYLIDKMDLYENIELQNFP